VLVEGTVLQTSVDRVVDEIRFSVVVQVSREGELLCERASVQVPLRGTPQAEPPQRSAHEQIEEEKHRRIL